MAARKKKPLQRYQISLEHKGKTYQAHYYVESGVVFVEAMSEDGTRARIHTQGGGSTAEHTARMLLRELIDAGRVVESPQ